MIQVRAFVSKKNKDYIFYYSHADHLEIIPHWLFLRIDEQKFDHFDEIEFENILGTIDNFEVGQ